MEHIKAKTEQLVEAVSQVIIGKEEQIRLITMAIFAGGHILLDDLPGVGKTTLVKTMAKALGCAFSRVQFTPDLLPSDIMGMKIYDQKAAEFSTEHGPIMTNIFLADEINRAIPRTQSALLEAMEELQVTIDAKTYPLPQPFFVMATQNPVEMESTFRLPIAQMDRFLIRLSLGYPSYEEEILMLKTVGDETPLYKVDKLCDDAELVNIQKEIRNVQISDNVLGYIAAITDGTRKSGQFRLPAGPRGSRALYRAGKAWAAMAGRDYVTPDDIKHLAPWVLAHRVTVTSEMKLQGKNEEDAIRQILTETAAPGTKEEILNGENQ